MKPAPMKQATGSSDAHGKTCPNNDAGVVHTGDKTTVEGPTAVEREEEMVAEASRGKPRTATTVSSESKQTGQSSNVHTSSNAFEQETDPTSSPSEILDKPDRKCTESPIDSDEAVWASDSVHSEFSESSTDANDSKKKMKAAVNADKVEAIGRQFEDLGIGNEAVSFHNPADDDEARHINDMVRKAHSKPFIITVCLIVTDHLRRHHEGYRRSSRGTLSRSRIRVPSLRTTQRVSRTCS